MNKKLIAGLLSISMIAGLQTPVTLLAYTVPIAKQSIGQLENKGMLTSEFSLVKDANYQAYAEVFQVTGIKAYTNNGGQYNSSALHYAFDGDVQTHWETGRPNSETHKNEVIVTFNDVEEINLVAYAPRPGNKGHVQKMSIYASLTESGEDFELVATGETSIRSSMSAFRFQTASFKRLKFVFDQANQDWAAAGEFKFFREDNVADAMEELFVNGLMMEVSAKYNSIDAIHALEQQVHTHPLKDKYIENIELAKALINNKDLFKDTRIVMGEQRGRYREESSKRKFGGHAYTSFESIGKYVTPGETIVVYLDADPRGVLPQLCLGQVAQNKGDWRRFLNLQPGKNVIKVPTDINPSALYLFNDVRPSEQAYAPRVRVEGGTAFPLYIHGETNPQAFYEEVQAYTQKIAYRDEAFANGNPEGKVFNIAEFISDNVVITTTATGALAGMTEAHTKGYDMADTMSGWEEMYTMFQTYMDFEEEAMEEKHSYFPNKFIARGFLGVPHAFAGHGFTGYLGSSNLERDGGFFKLLAMPPQMPGNDNWAYTHEFGHIFNTGSIIQGEVTNNLYAQEYRRLKGIKGDRANWNELMKRFKGEEVRLGHFENLGILSQLDLAYGYDTYGKVSRFVRDNPQLIASVQGNDLRRLAVAYSLAIGENLLDFFGGWNYVDITPQMEEMVAHLPKPNRKIEYLHGEAYDYKGNGFNDAVDLKVTTQRDEMAKTHTLKFEIDNTNRKDVLGYEILKNEEVIGYTKEDIFVVKDVALDENEMYQVRAYAKDLSTAPVVQVNTYSPSLTTQQEKIIIKLGEVFNPKEGVRGLNYKGEDITSQIKTTHNVDTTRRGSYEVVYSLVDEGIVVEKMVQVEVVSDYDYLSDWAWQSAETQWSTPRRNSNIRGRVNGEIKTFEKGFGIHAKGKIVYDLSHVDYDQFEALVGVDMGIEAQNNSSIVFNIVGDGKVLATTKVMRHADNMAYINVPIKNVKELVIEVGDGGNGISSDHAVIANPKLTTNNAPPTLVIPKDEAVKVGEVRDDLYGTYYAVDAEDGVLTSAVEVTGEVNFKQPGYYPITYKVKDSDGNEVVKTRYIAVVAMEDFTYVSDYDWKSATCGWGSIKKDRSPSDQIIRLTNSNNEEVQFEKGLGAHARSVIHYDLTNKDADYFSAYVGVDRDKYGSIGSVAFEVWVDGEKVVETDVIGSRDPMVYIEVDVSGAKELVLISTDGGNGNGSDHAVWADAKFHYANANNIKVDTQPLLEALERINQLNPEHYTKSSWHALRQVQEQALALLENNLTQEQVDTMTQIILQAKEDLVAIGDKSNLIRLVTSINHLEAHLYTQLSWETLLSEQAAAEEVLKQEEPTQDILNQAAQTLQQALDALELSKGKAGLYALLEVANTMQASDYSQAADWTTFEEMTALYNDIYWAPTVHSEPIYEVVLDYYSWLIQSIEAHRIPTINQSKLEALITSVKRLEAHLYTQITWENLLQVYEQATQVLDREEVSQQVIDEAAQTLQEALDALELSKGKAGLYALLEVANTMQASDYSQEADWATFEEMTALYNDIYWAPTVHSEPIYEVVLDYYSWLIQSIEAHRLTDGQLQQEVSEGEVLDEVEIEL